MDKTPTGIVGLDEITGGGLPQGRPTLVCGTAGCGKTLLAMEFLVRGATQFGEPGVFMCFEENETELTDNVASLGFDLQRLVAGKKMAIDYVRVERSEIEETGEYDLEGLFIRLNSAIDAIGAKRVVLDTIEALFAGLPNEAILRGELRRLFRWLKDKGVTAVITGERGSEGSLTRHGLEEYVADCVILLDHRVQNQISTRRLRVVKYRGSIHGTNEYPFLISNTGISVLPITSIGLTHAAPGQRVSTGVDRLDTMLGGKGYYRGSSVLVSGTAGTGKTTLGAAFAEAACKRGERTLYFAFEESQDQIMRNMASVGIELRPWVAKKMLEFHTVRPSLCGLEMHLLAIHEQVRIKKPKIVVIDPITNLISAGEEREVRSMLTRLIDFFKTHQITAIFTSLTWSGDSPDQSEVEISSLMDAWICLRNIEHGGERNRGLYVRKARGIGHSNQVREFQLSDGGIDLLDLYVGAGTVLTGSARLVQEARDVAEMAARQEHIARLRRAMERKQLAIDAQVAVLRAELEADLEELKQEIKEQSEISDASVRQTKQMARKRMADLQSVSVRDRLDSASSNGNGKRP